MSLLPSRILNLDANHASHCSCLSPLYSVAFDTPKVFAIFARGSFCASNLIRLSLSNSFFGLPTTFPTDLALDMPSFVLCTSISLSLSATHVSIPIISLRTLGSVICKNDSLGEQEINGAYSSIALIASRVSQNVRPTLDSS